MKPTTIKRLQSFIGKVCSILTTSVAKSNFTDVQFNDFFVCIIEEVNEDGVFATHTMTKCLAFYSWTHIVSILEEQAKFVDDPDYETILEEVKKAPVEQQVNILPVNSGKYMNPDALENLAKQAKEMQERMKK